MDHLTSIATRIAQLRMARHFGRVHSMRAGLIRVEGLNGHASVGDRVLIALQQGQVAAEVVALAPRHADVLPLSLIHI